MEICNNCEHHSSRHKTIRPDVHCMKCGCTLDAKTKCLSCECPIGKWKALVSAAQEEEMTKQNEKKGSEA